MELFLKSADRFCYIVPSFLKEFLLNIEIQVYSFFQSLLSCSLSWTVCGNDTEQDPVGLLGTKTFCVPHSSGYRKQASCSLHDLP